jgi:FHS family L-fucose permease-like MFS transporter
MAFFKRRSLRNRDDQRTRAAELTLRESIYPLMLVTILFFLWVSNTPYTEVPN